MKVIHINSTCFGSTGNIAKNICILCEENNIESLLFVPKSKSNIKFANSQTRLFGFVSTRGISRYLEEKTGKLECFNFFNTFSLIAQLKKEKPDIIHLHNLHGSFVNIDILFKYIKKSNIKIIWTLHDCWAFTGRCPYFSLSGCNNWVNGCFDCKFSSEEYPQAKRKKEYYLWEKKRKLFNSVKNMTICTPSMWLYKLVKNSYLKSFSTTVVNNGIDLSVYKVRDSSYKLKNNINFKYIILGVAFVWGKRKGLDAFIELSKVLPNDYCILMVGTDSNIDKLLPNNVISINKTSNVDELVDIYNASDVFFNPTREEVFGLVNIEALACGTPVVTFDTDGSPECINEKTGFVVPKNNIARSLEKIRLICESKVIDKRECLERAKLFDWKSVFSKYIFLYKKSITDFGD